ncbi:MAG TPA: erythromycin esterase family protein [Ideonella sp.]|nr:erythromycin esterase family protein [Ideonella sp.]
MRNPFTETDRRAVDAIRRAAHVVDLERPDLDPVLVHIGDAPLVLLGESTHGSEEFYRLRADLTLRLIDERGFDAVAVEADWPDALRVSRWVQGADDDADADAALAGFMRFPRWMWRNTAVRDWIERLRTHNLGRPAGVRRVGFFGLDLYSLQASMQAVVAFLEGVDPAAAADARHRYACFDGYVAQPQRYGAATHFGLARDCAREAAQQLQSLFGKAAARLADAGADAGDELFYAQQNARVVKNAEAYYRTMFDGRTDSWNLRDTHMTETLELLRAHLSQRLGRPAKIVVWAHNSHIGDARATEPAERGQLNLGQLVRERDARDETDLPYLLGFTTHTGAVAAASDWDEPVERKAVLRSREDSVEQLLHGSGLGNFFLPLEGEAARALDRPRLERAIGVIYRPDSERLSHYFRAALADQFDGVIHVDETHAVTPLDPSNLWQDRSEPELAPTGM